MIPITRLSQVFSDADTDDKEVIIMVTAPFVVASKSLNVEIDRMVHQREIVYPSFVCDDEAHEVLEFLHVIDIPSVALCTRKKIVWSLSNPSVQQIRDKLPKNTEVEIQGAGMSKKKSMSNKTTSDMLVTSRFRVQGLCCEMEVSIVETLFQDAKGIKTFHCDPIGRKVHVEHYVDICDADHIVRLLNSAQLGASLQESNDPSADIIPFSWLKFMQFSVMLGCLVAGRFTKPALYYVCIVFGFYDLILPAARRLLHGILDISVLMSVAFAATIYREDNAEAAELAVLMTLSVFLTDEAMRRVRNALLYVSSAAMPQTVTLKNGTQKKTMDLMVDEELAIRAGEMIPVDGVVTEGSASVDESSVTGEVMPVHKSKLSKVIQGTVVQSGYINVRAVMLPQQSTLSALTEATQELKQNKTQVVDSFASWYTKVIMLAAVIIGVVCPWHFAQSVDVWVARATLLLVVACPCALVMTTPTALCIAVATAAKNGVLIKSQTVLETLPYISVVAFDKTGTLTDGTFQVVHSVQNSDFYEVNVGQLVASVESKSTHPAATALVHHFTGCVASALELYGSTAGLLPVTEYYMEEGVGVRGVVSGKLVRVGNAILIQGMKNVPEEFKDVVKQFPDCMHLYVLIDGVLAQLYVLHDRVRSTSMLAVSTLHNLRISTTLLSGDRADIVHRLQHLLGIRIGRGGLKPRDKLAHVVSVQRNKDVVLFVGDGVNDSLAISASDVGVSMTLSGTALATHAADVALISDDINRIPELIQFSNYVWRLVLTNIILCIVVKAAILIFALYGEIPLWVAVLSDLGSLVIVLLICSTLFACWPKNAAASNLVEGSSFEGSPLLSISPPSDYGSLGSHKNLLQTKQNRKN